MTNILSDQTVSVIELLGRLICFARKRRRLSQRELAERLCVSRQTVIAIEKGESKVAVGFVFEAAYLLGIPLLSADSKQIAEWRSLVFGFESILPRRVKKKRIVIDDDF